MIFKNNYDTVLLSKSSRANAAFAADYNDNYSLYQIFYY